MFKYVQTFVYKPTLLYLLVIAMVSMFNGEQNNHVQGLQRV